MTNIFHELILGFRGFILRNWKDKLVSQLSDQSRSNWLQGNWELLVEAQLGSNFYLEPYGDGADIDDSASSRFSETGIAQRFRAACRFSADAKLQDLLRSEVAEIELLTFEQFVSWENGKFDVSPPFDHVLMSDDSGKLFLYHLDSIVFELVSLN